MRRLLALPVALFLLAARPTSAERPETFKVREGLSQIVVDTRAPYPTEIDSETQGRALAKDAAVALGQNAILRHVLNKRARSGMTLNEAQVPSTEIQESISALVVGAKVSNVRFDKEGCRLRISVSKKNLKVILRKA